MAGWATIEKEAAVLAALVRSRIERHRHHGMGAIRLDGSPRLSGTELSFEGGELTIGAMAGSMKVRDLRRDPRIAIHSATEDRAPLPTIWSSRAGDRGEC